MATARDIVNGALRLIDIPDPTADESTDTLAALNDMLAAWTIDGIDLGLSTLTLSDAIDTEAAYLRGLRFNLAVEIAPEFGIMAMQKASGIAGIAEREKMAIRAALFTIEEMSFEAGLTAGFLARGEYYSG